MLDVYPYDWEPDQPHGKTSHTDIPILLRELKGSAFESVLTAKEITKLEGVHAVNITSPDIPSLAAAIINWLVDAKRVATVITQRGALEDALARAAPRRVSVKEEGVFVRVSERFVVKSRSKGVANEVELNQLEPAMRDGVNAMQQTVAARNALLGELNTYTSQPQLSPATQASLNLTEIRSAHTNRSGWLPSTVVPAALDQAAETWARGVAVNGKGNARAEIQAKFGGEGERATSALALEDAELDDAVMRNYYREVLHVTLPTAPQKARHAWRQYADPQFPGCPYIEFTASDAGGLSRYVWGYQNDQWYIGVHYNWVHGYNPFIFVRGMQPSL
jgi:hypothetical protein